MSYPSNKLFTVCLLLASGGWGVLPAFAQPASPPAPAVNKESKDNKKETQDQKGQNKPSDNKQLTAEQLAELVIYFSGSRPVLQQIRRTGVERGRIVRTLGERTEEATYDLRFVQGENASKDKVRFDQQMPTLEYALIYNQGKVFGILKGAVFTPRQEAADEMLARSRRGVEALLRYKENGATVALVGKEKQQNIDLYVLDLTDTEGRRTRYYISSKFFRVLWAEYDETNAAGRKVSYKCRYSDYRSAQSTLVPFRSVLYRDGEQILETQILTVTYGAKADETLFQNPEQAAATP